MNVNVKVNVYESWSIDGLSGRAVGDNRPYQELDAGACVLKGYLSFCRAPFHRGRGRGGLLRQGYGG